MFFKEAVLLIPINVFKFNIDLLFFFIDNFISRLIILMQWSTENCSWGYLTWSVLFWKSMIDWLISRRKSWWHFFIGIKYTPSHLTFVHLLSHEIAYLFITLTLLAFPLIIVLLFNSDVKFEFWNYLWCWSWSNRPRWAWSGFGCYGSSSCQIRLSIGIHLRLSHRNKRVRWTSL